MKALKPFYSLKRLNFLQRYVLEWLSVLLCLLLLAWAIQSSSAVQLTNNYVYDRLISLQEREPDPSIVIIAVDDYSLQTLGRWPWSREIHQRLFESLPQAKPRGVLFDFLLTEPSESSEVDAQLGQAVAATPHVVLPVLLASYGGAPPITTEPVTSIAQYASLGHILVRPDDDGVLRQVDLNLTDANGREWPLATRLLLPNSEQFSHTKQLRIPFNIPKGTYPTIPYAAVVNGQVPLEFFHDKYVLVGATAAGLGDQYTTPISGASGLVPGIEIHANILDSLLSGQHLSVLNFNGFNWLNWLLPLLMLMLAFFWTVERYHAVLLAVFIASYGVLVLLLLTRYHLWLPPALTIVLLLLAYFLWSWRRLSVVLGYVEANLKKAQQERGGLSQLIQVHQKQWFVPSSIERGMQQMQRLYQFTDDSLQHMPSALLVVTEAGEIVLSNSDANTWFGREANIVSLLQKVDVNWQKPTSDQTHWLNQLDGVELKHADGRVFVLHVSAVAFNHLDAEYQVAWSNQSVVEEMDCVWLVHFLDFSEERLAQQQRSELMGFLSHDLRSPQVAILSLLALQKNPNTRLSENELYAKIEARVHHTLDWAHDLARLSHARAGQYRFDEMSLATVLEDAFEQLEPQAKAKQMSLDLSLSDHMAAQDAWLYVDGELLLRALVNLLSNSIRYSSAGNSVEVRVHIYESGSEVSAEPFVECRIIDHGHGMTKLQIQQLLHEQLSASSLAERNVPDAAGSMGIGFIMARTVVQRHGGQIMIESELGVGTTVVVCLPLTIEGSKS